MLDSDGERRALEWPLQTVNAIMDRKPVELYVSKLNHFSSYSFLVLDFVIISFAFSCSKQILFHSSHKTHENRL